MRAIEFDGVTYQCPYANLLPPLNEKDYADLRQDIEQRGVLVAVEIDEYLNVIDGQHRLMIAAELGLDHVPFNVRAGLNDGEKQALAWGLNAHRRHMTREQRQECALKLRQQGMSYRAIGEKLGVDPMTARSDVHSTVENSTVELPERVSGKDGKSRPARKPAVVRADSAKDSARAGRLAQRAPDLAGGVQDVRDLQRAVKGRERDERRQQAAALSARDTQAAHVELYQGDALDIVPLLENESIALAINDPPYNTTTHDWDQFGERENFLLWTQSWLNALRPKLRADYHLFVFCAPEYAADIEILLRDNGWPLKSRVIWEYRNLVKGRDVAGKFIVNYQMVLHCGTHPLNWSPEWDESRFAVQRHATPQSNFKEGKDHPTQKPLSLIRHFVAVGSAPGDTVLDMFAGSGTTGAACNAVGDRRCILVEFQDEYCANIERRLAVARKGAGNVI